MSIGPARGVVLAARRRQDQVDLVTKLDQVRDGGPNDGRSSDSAFDVALLCPVGARAVDGPYSRKQ